MIRLTLQIRAYFEDVNRQSYVGTLWSSPRRSRWVIQKEGLKRVRPELFNSIMHIRSCVTKQKSSYINNVIQKKEEIYYEAEATH